MRVRKLIYFEWIDSLTHAKIQSRKDGGGKLEASQHFHQENFIGF